MDWKVWQTKIQTKTALIEKNKIERENTAGERQSKDNYLSIRNSASDRALQNF